MDYTPVFNLNEVRKGRFKLVLEDTTRDIGMNLTFELTEDAVVALLKKFTNAVAFKENLHGYYHTIYSDDSYNKAMEIADAKVDMVIKAIKDGKQEVADYLASKLDHEEDL
jgi:hypothetical protein